jgi:hypothetical protein
VTGRGSTHIDTAFMGLTSSDGVTVNCKLQARASSRPILSQPRDHDSKRARAVAERIRRGARLVPVTVDGLILAAPRCGPDLGRRCPDEVRSWPLRELVVGELDDQRDDDAQQDDPNESTSAFECEVDAKSGTREVAWRNGRDA